MFWTSQSFAQDPGDVLLSELQEHISYTNSVERAFRNLEGYDLARKPKLEELLIQCLSDADPQVVHNTLLGFPYFDWEKNARLKAAMLRLASHSLPKIRIDVLIAIQSRTHALGPQEFTIQRSKNVMNGKLFNLSERDAALKSIVIQSLSDPDESVREYTLEMIKVGDFESPEQFEKTLLSFFDPQSQLRPLPLGHLPKLNWYEHKGATDFVLSALKDPSRQNLSYIVTALRENKQWLNNEAFKQALIEIFHDNESSVYDRMQTLGFFEHLDWYESKARISVIQSLSDPLLQDQATKLILNKAVFDKPDIMVSFAEHYLRLPEDQRLKLLSRHSDLFLQIIQPDAELMILSDIEKILSHFKPVKVSSLSLATTPYYGVIHGLLVKKLDHPKAKKIYERLVFRLLTSNDPVQKLTGVNILGESLPNIKQYPKLAERMLPALKKLVELRGHWSSDKTLSAIYDGHLDNEVMPNFREHMNESWFLSGMELDNYIVWVKKYMRPKYPSPYLMAKADLKSRSAGDILIKNFNDETEKFNQGLKTLEW